MSQLTFSYNSLNDLIICPHSWINKRNGKKKPYHEGMGEGRTGHRLIQDHVGGIKPCLNLDYMTDRYETVEQKAFDKNTYFEFMVSGYKITGYEDIIDAPNLRNGEIKLSTTPWTKEQYQQSNQRKVYTLAHPSFKRSVLITGKLDPTVWKKEKLSVIEIPITDRDRQEARDWILEGLTVFEDGDFSSGLDPDTGRCTQGNCPYGENCHFRSF